MILNALLLLFTVSGTLLGEDKPKTSVVKQQLYEAKDFTYLLGMQGFSNDLLTMHFKLYQGYVKNSNMLLALLGTLSNADQVQYGALKRRIGWEFNGMILHELYFENLGGKKALDRTSPLFRAIEADFGSFEAWKKDFISTGMMRGIGWAILYRDPLSKRLLNVWINEHDLGHLAGGKPILIMDVFEHAYMPQYGLDRDKYIEAFFQNINWEAAAKRY